MEDARQTLAEKIRQQQERISVLSHLINITERQLARTHPTDSSYTLLRDNLESYRGEYWQITGKEYEPPTERER